MGNDLRFIISKFGIYHFDHFSVEISGELFYLVFSSIFFATFKV